MQGSTLTKNPLAQIEDEQVAHQEKLRRMNEDMEDVFRRKVEEKTERMRRLAREEEARLDRERSGLAEDKRVLAARRAELDQDKKSWAASSGVEMSKLLAR